MFSSLNALLPQGLVPTPSEPASREKDGEGARFAGIFAELGDQSQNPDGRGTLDAATGDQRAITDAESAENPADTAPRGAEPLDDSDASVRADPDVEEQSPLMRLPAPPDLLPRPPRAPLMSGANSPNKAATNVQGETTDRIVLSGQDVAAKPSDPVDIMPKVAVETVAVPSESRRFEPSIRRTFGAESTPAATPRPARASAPDGGPEKTSGQLQASIEPPRSVTLPTTSGVPLSGERPNGNSHVLSALVNSGNQAQSILNSTPRQLAFEAGKIVVGPLSAKNAAATPPRRDAVPLPAAPGRLQTAITATPAGVEKAKVATPARPGLPVSVAQAASESQNSALPTSTLPGGARSLSHNPHVALPDPTTRASPTSAAKTPIGSSLPEHFKTVTPQPDRARVRAQSAQDPAAKSLLKVPLQHNVTANVQDTSNRTAPSIPASVPTRLPDATGKISLIEQSTGRTSPQPTGRETPVSVPEKVTVLPAPSLPVQQSARFSQIAPTDRKPTLPPQTQPIGIKAPMTLPSPISETPSVQPTVAPVPDRRTAQDIRSVPADGASRGTAAQDKTPAIQVPTGSPRPVLPGSEQAYVVNLRQSQAAGTGHVNHDIVGTGRLQATPVPQPFAEPALIRSMPRDPSIPDATRKTDAHPINSERSATGPGLAFASTRTPQISSGTDTTAAAQSTPSVITIASTAMDSQTAPRGVPNQLTMQSIQTRVPPVDPSKTSANQPAIDKNAGSDRSADFVAKPATRTISDMPFVSNRGANALATSRPESPMQILGQRLETPIVQSGHGIIPGPNGSASPQQVASASQIKATEVPQTPQAMRPVANPLLKGSDAATASAQIQPVAILKPAEAARPTKSRIESEASSVIASDRADFRSRRAAEPVDVLRAPAPVTNSNQTSIQTPVQSLGTAPDFPVEVAKDRADRREADADLQTLGISGTESRGSIIPSATALHTRPETAAAVLRQLVDVAGQVKDGPIELRLNPEELGRVRMSMVTSDQGIVMHITSERPETLDLMRRNIEQLQRDLTQLGYTSVAFSFGQSGQGGQESNRRNDAMENSPAINVSDMPMTQTTPPQIQADDGLDIRL